MAEAIAHCGAARRDDLAAELLEAACTDHRQLPGIDGQAKATAASSHAAAAFVSVYELLSPEAHAAAMAMGLDWSKAIELALRSEEAARRIGGVMAAIDLGSDDAGMALARDVVCQAGATAEEASRPELSVRITAVCAALAARIAASPAGAETDGQLPRFLQRMVFALGGAASAVDRHKQDVVIELIGEALVRLRLGGGRIARDLAEGVLVSADSPAAIVLRTRLRRTKHARWDGAALWLLGVPSVGASAAERLVRFEPGACAVLAERRHALLVPARLEAVGRQLAAAKGSDRSLRAAIGQGDVGERAALAVLVAASFGTPGQRVAPVEADEAVGRLAHSKNAGTRHGALRVAIGMKMSSQVLEGCFDLSPSVARSAALATVFGGGKRGKSASRVLEVLAKSNHAGVRRLAERMTERPAEISGHAWPEGDDAMVSRRLVGLRGRPVDADLAEALSAFVAGEALGVGLAMPRTAAAALPLLARCELPAAARAIDEALTAADARIRSAAFEATAVRGRLSGDENQMREAKLTVRAGLGDGHHRVRGSCVRAVMLIDPGCTQARHAARRAVCEMVESKFALNQRAAMWAVSAVASEFAGDAQIAEAVHHVRTHPADEAAIWRAERAGQGLETFAAMRSAERAADAASGGVS